MRRRKPYNPADYNLVANPSLPKTNSPWRVWGVLVLVGLVCFVAWPILRGPVHVSRPTLEFSGERVVVNSVATNDTYRSVHLTLRFVVARAGPANEEHPARFDVVAQREMEIVVPSRSTAPLRCEFVIPEKLTPNEAEVEILSRR
ncbi:MAG: hypothetical protein ABJF10_12210 [Chthoniobacter sp.]|uniref:hypothetical protein n=1 Tax=Chthoniobacter sp. TaxID=2510640 RepID=UPI0032A3BDF2